MKKGWIRRIISLVLACCMCCTLTPLVSAADIPVGENGYLFYLTYSDIQAHDREMPTSGATNPIEWQLLSTVYLAQNELEGVQIFYREQTQPRNISVEVSSFTNDAGETLPSTLYNEAFFKNDTVQDDALADALLPYRGEALTTEVDHNKMFYVELHSAKNQTPGNYTATVRLYGDGALLEERTITAVVWNFALPESHYTQLVSGLYNGVSGYGDTSGILKLSGVNMDDSGNPVTEEDRIKAEKILENTQEFLLEHGVSTYEIPRWQLQDDPQAAKLTMADPRRKVFIVPTGGYQVSDDTLDDHTVATMNTYKGITYDNAFLKDKVFFYMIDEPKDVDLLNTTLTSLSNALNKVWPGYHMVVPFFSNATSVSQVFSGKADIFCPNQNLLTSQDAMSVLENGNWSQVWRYPGDSQLGSFYLYTWPILSMGVMRRILYWQQYALGTDGGILSWNCAYYTDWNSANHVWNPWENLTLPGSHGVAQGNGDGILLYPNPDPANYATPIASLRLKQIASGMDDYDYLKLAEEFIGSDYATAEMKKIFYHLDAANGDLTHILNRNCASDHNGAGGTDYNSWCCTDMAAIRLELGNALSEANTEHKYGEWQVAVAPTGTEEGLEIRTCADCGTQESRAIPATGVTTTYTVTFDAAGGNAVSPQTVESGNPAAAPDAPTRDGYTFDGWYLNDTPYDFTSPVSGDITLTAHWIASTYAVSYEANGGQGTMAPSVAEMNTPITVKENEFTRDGYTFVSWNTQANGSGKSFLPQDSYQPASPTDGNVLFSMDNPHENFYNIQYNAAKGGVIWTRYDDDSPDAAVHHTCWSDSLIRTMEGPTTFRSIFDPSLYSTVDFLPGQAYWCDLSLRDVPGEEGTSYYLGIVFTGPANNTQYTTEMGFTPIAKYQYSTTTALEYYHDIVPLRLDTGYFIQAVDAQHVLYAQWQKDASDIVLYLDKPQDGGIDEGSEIWYRFTAPATGTYIFGTTGPTDTFGVLCWDMDGKLITSNDDSGIDRNFKITRAMTEGETLYLKVRGYIPKISGEYSVFVTRQPETYTVNYDANGGKNAPADQTKVEGTPLTLSTTVPTRDGYNFLGWSTAKDAADAQFQPEESFTVDANITLYAIWVEDLSFTDLVLDQPLDGHITHGSYSWYAFTAPEDGNYVFTSIGSLDTIGGLYQEINGLSLSDNDDGGEGYNFKLVQKMTAGQTLYLQVSSYSSRISGDYAVLVTREDAAVISLNQGESAEGSISDGSYSWYQFTAPADSTYTFTTTGSTDTYGELYTSMDSDRVSFNDDSGEGRNFKISYALTAGQTIYLKVRGYSTVTFGDYAISVD